MSYRFKPGEHEIWLKIIHLRGHIERKRPGWGFREIKNNEYEVKGVFNYTVKGIDDLYRAMLGLSIAAGINTHKDCSPPIWIMDNREAYEFWIKQILDRSYIPGKKIKTFGKRITIYKKPNSTYTNKIIIYTETTKTLPRDFIIESIFYLDETKYNNPIKIRASRDWNRSIWEFVEQKKMAPSEAINRLIKLNKELYIELVKAFGLSFQTKGLAGDIFNLYLFFWQRNN